MSQAKTHYWMGWMSTPKELCKLDGGAVRFYEQKRLDDQKIDCPGCLDKITVKPMTEIERAQEKMRYKKKR